MKEHIISFEVVQSDVSTHFLKKHCTVRRRENNEIETRTEIWTSLPQIGTELTGPADPARGLYEDPKWDFDGLHFPVRSDRKLGLGDNET